MAALIRPTWTDAQTAELVVQTGHGAKVNCVAFSPNGRVLASGGSKVKLHDAATGKELRTMTLHGSVVWSLAFNEKLVAAGGFDINLFDAATGKNVGAWRGHGYGVAALAFSPDGKTLASGDRSVWLWDYTNAKPSLGEWDIEVGKPGIELKGHSEPVTSVAFSPDGKLLASASKDKSVTVWDVAARKAVRTLSGHTAAVNSVAFRADERFLVTGSDDGTVRLWDAASGTQTAVLMGHTGKVNSVSFDATGLNVISGGSDGTLRVWDLKTKRLLRAVEGNEKEVLSVAASSNGKWIATGSENRTARLLDTTANYSPRVIAGPTNAIFATAFSADGNWLATGGTQLILWDLYGGGPLSVLAATPDLVSALTFSTDRTILVSADHKRNIRLWDIASGSAVKTIPDPPTQPPKDNRDPDPIWLLSMSADNKKLARQTSPGEIKVWNLETGQISGPFNGRAPEVRDQLKGTFPDLFEKLPALISETDKLVVRPTMGFNSVLLIRKGSYEPLVTLVVLDETHWVMTAVDGRFDTNQDFEAIEGVHWVFSNDPFKPVALETLMRQYYEPNLFSRQMTCIDDRNCNVHFRPLPSITQVLRTRPRAVFRRWRK